MSRREKLRADWIESWRATGEAEAALGHDTTERREYLAAVIRRDFGADAGEIVSAYEAGAATIGGAS